MVSWNIPICAYTDDICKRHRNRGEARFQNRDPTSRVWEGLSKSFSIRDAVRLVSAPTLDFEAGVSSFDQSWESMRTLDLMDESASSMSPDWIATVERKNEATASVIVACDLD